MKKISILYPNRPDAKFDFQYYAETHMPLSIQLLSSHAGFRGVSVERGIGTSDPGMPVPYIAMCHFLFDSVESFIEAFTPHAATLQGDIPNYTDIEPILQFNEVLIAR
jgi:uncharacterized protein (TIGR02118 family)